jgi:hypothetical protein
MVSKPILLIPFFALAIVFSVFLLANQYWFQKAYSKKIGVPADTEKFITVLLRGIKVYVFQFLIFLGVTAAVVAAFVAAGYLMKARAGGFRIMITFATFALVVFAVIWFYRLLFVSSILMYTRVSAKSRAIIQESKYLVEENLAIIITMIVVGLIVILPPVIINLCNPAFSRTNPLITVISGVLGLINSLFFMIITVNAVIEHKYFFLLAPRKETN